MNDITLNLIVLSALIMIGGVIFFLVRRRQVHSERELIQLAAEKGWKYETIHEPLAWGLRLTSPRWTLESISRSNGREAGPGSSDVASSTVWRANAAGSTFLLGERTSQTNLGGMGEMLTRQALQFALGAEASGLNEIQAGSEAFRQKYMIWAQDASQIRISPMLENTLLGWKGSKPLIKRTSDGLTMELRGVHLKTINEICPLIQLGEVIVEMTQ